jgi:hypothetical protein
MIHDTHPLVMEIFSQLAEEKNKSIEQIAHLLLVVENQNIVHRFWKILDDKLPWHTFESVGCCANCGSFELI